MARRLRERGRGADVAATLMALAASLPAEVASAYALLPAGFEEIVQDMIDSSGTRSFHDSLMVVYARRHGIQAIASFDRDFDGVAGLTRIAG
jgi:predicted nucleic acid-binding protein